MKALSFIIATALSLSSFAAPVQKANGQDQVIKNIMKNAKVIHEEVQLTYASPSELKRALEHMRAAKELIMGSGLDDDFSSNTSELRCVSKDNDNRGPYVYATLKSDFSLVKVQGVQFYSIEQCETSLRRAEKLGGKQLICASKDGDDRRPWVVANLEGSVATKNANLSFTSFDKCREAFTHSTLSNGKLAFCTSKDGDDLAPYVIGMIDRRTGEVSRASGQFGSLAECQTLLGR